MTNQDRCAQCEGRGFHVYPPGYDRFNLPLPYDTVLPCLHCDATGVRDTDEHPEPANPPQAPPVPLTP